MTINADQGKGNRTPRLKRDHLGYDIRDFPLPLGSADWSQYQIIDGAGPNSDSPSFSGDDLAILLSLKDQPAEFVNGMIRMISPETLHAGEYYTLREPNDYRFHWSARRWEQVAEADRPGTT